MLGRYVLLTLGVIALLWTGYVAIDLIDKKDELSPLNYFGREDEKILIIHRQQEVDISSIDFKTTAENNEIIAALNLDDAHVKSLYLSSKRSHLLLENNELWNRELIRKLFNSATFDLDFSGVQTFKVGKFTGEIYRNRLYLSVGNYVTQAMEMDWSKHDKKSSASLISFTKNAFNLTDIYFKETGRIDYITKTSANIAGSQIKDRNLFAHVLPENLTDYHFFEKEYLGSVDNTLKNGPMYSWMDKGMVEFKVNGQTVIISDYKESQDPVNSLFDFVKQDPSNEQYGYFDQVELTQSFPQNSKLGFYAFSMDDFVVLCSDKETCEKIVAEYKLGNTLSQDPEKIAEIYSDLPERVSERFASNSNRYSKTVYKGQLFQTMLPSSSEKMTSDTKVQNESITMKTGGTIHDYFVQAGKGNIVSITKNGNVALFKNGKRQWERNLGSTAIGQIQEIELNATQYFLFTTKNGIHIIDLSGNSLSGFPFVTADSEFTAHLTVYSWKNKNYMIVPDSKGNLIQIDFKGKKTTTIKTGLSDIKSDVNVWVSNRKLFYGINNSNTFKMFDAEARREFRSFSISENTFAGKSENELFHYSFENSELYRYDQKGNKTTLGGGWNNFKIQGINDKTSLQLLAYSTGVFKLVDKDGTIKTIINSKAKEIENVSIHILPDGKTLLCIVDGLENDVYLHGLNGQLFVNQAFEGTGKSTVSQATNGKYLLTTIVDDFIVQYSVN